MAYVDQPYYLSTYFGVDAGCEFSRLAARASDDVDLATGYGITTVTDLIKKAVCSQIEFYFLNGDTYNEPEKAESVSILSFSQTKALTQPKPTGGLCARALQFLEQTGLMERRAALVGEYGVVGDE